MSTILRALPTSLILLVCAGFLQADEFTATLVKVEDGKVTYSRGSGKKKKVTTLPADEKCKVVVAKYDAKAKRIDAGDEIADGLKNAIFQKLDKEPVEAWIRTSENNERILEMRLFQSTKKKKQ